MRRYDRSEPMIGAVDDVAIEPASAQRYEPVGATICDHCMLAVRQPQDEPFIVEQRA